jgi:hypothetical protein
MASKNEPAEVFACTRFVRDNCSEEILSTPFDCKLDRHRWLGRTRPVGCTHGGTAAACKAGAASLAARAARRVGARFKVVRYCLASCSRHTFCQQPVVPKPHSTVFACLRCKTAGAPVKRNGLHFTSRWQQLQVSSLVWLLQAVDGDQALLAAEGAVASRRDNE